jgi:hypothetical protein
MSYITKIFNTPFFQNKFVLYGSLLLVLLSILRHLANKNINAVVLIALIGLLMSYFSKNMIIVLLTAFATVFILEMVGSQGVMEGMVSKKEDEDDDETTDDDKTDKKGEDEKDEPTEDKDKSKDNASAEKKTEGNKTLNEKKNKQGMTKLSPASYDGKDHDGEGADGMKEANRIDYASTLEQAYDNIENIIGEEGVRGLTDQTKSLMNQQKELMNNMKEMGPLLKSAEGFMHQMTGNGGIQGITNMLKGFATPGSEKKK